jgi:hypothetical protein
MRQLVVRVLEWRARWFSDPVDRLQFLRRNAPKPPKAPKAPRDWRRTFEHLPAFGITLGLAVAAGLFFLYPRHTTAAASVRPSPAVRARQGKAEAQAPGSVWLVKETQQFDLYSNGLRIENQAAAGTAPRRYLAFVRSGPRAGEPRWRTEPAGIVFHTTESHIAPFEEDENLTLQRAGEGLLDYVNRTRAYHFVIDRFGRVFRVVREGDYANHAGNSVWADEAWVYVNLNQSFFGVAFEAQSAAAGTGLPITPAQVHAGRVLTDMLRARYGILAANCVTHAQVSVNPGNMRAGYHVDWAANLPFVELGLADNYERPPAGMTVFGFRADEGLVAKSGPSLEKGIAAADEQLQREATARGMSIDLYRKTLHRKYRDAMRALRGNAALQEYNHE